MNDAAEQRPAFYEGEILSAADLQQLLVYQRDQASRHAVGHHTWGIVAGLQLVEQAADSGAMDVYLLPGYAIDGYGRAVIVINPLRLNVDWFGGQPSGPVQVWLRYEQGETNAARPGFQVCCSEGEAYSRVAESYAIEVGNLSLATQQSGISIAGESVADARTALRLFDDSGPLVCDGSVPYQDLPLVDEARSRWLIPLGQVQWKNGTPGTFGTIVDPTNTYKEIYSRRLRRYAGVVAESVFASDQLIRLRRRTHGFSGTDPKAISDACGLEALTHERFDTAFDKCADGAMANELVWVEGPMRAMGDVRVLAPSRLELRDELGTNYDKGSPPTLLQRTDTKTAGEMNADLQVVLGAAKTGHNRLLIQQATIKTDVDPPLPPCAPVPFDFVTKVAVLDNGKVGIGTDDPDELLEIASDTSAFIHLRNTVTPSDLYLGAAELGGVVATINEGDIRFRAGGTDPNEDTDTAMTVAANKKVGIGTTAPDMDLTVERPKKADLIVRSVEHDHEVLLRAHEDGALVTASVAGDDLMLGADGVDPIVWVKANGRVGINEDAPAHDLGITNSGDRAEIATFAKGGATNRKMVLGSETNGVHAGSATDHDFRLKTNNTSRMIIKTNGRVGIDTDSPAEQLDVRGSIKLGSAGQYYAPGGFANWAIVAGSIKKGGASQSGPGWTAAYHTNVTPDPDHWHITFSPSFNKVPIVTATAVESNVHAYITNLSVDDFRVVLDGDDDAFNFIALVER